MQSTMSRRTLEEMATRRDRSGSLWLVQAFSGLLLVFILGAHMIAHHFIVEGGLRNYQQVLEYVANPVVFIIEVLFVILAVIHALLGVRAIVIDLRPSAAACLLYTSDAADERSSVDLGGRRIIKKKKQTSD